MPLAADKKQLYKKRFLLQKDSSDCGVACMQNILRYYNIELSLEYLREISGTDINGTTVLGLYQAAEKLGFTPVGAEAVGTETLKEINTPCILHTSENILNHHFVICYGWENKQFILGDPAKGIIKINEDQLENIWASKVVLFLEPTHTLYSKVNQHKKRWHWIIEIAKKYSRVLGFAGLLGLIVSILNLGMAIFTQKLVDNLLTNRSHLTIYWGLSLLFIVMLSKGAINYARVYIINRQSRKMNIDITSNFYKRMLSLPKSFFDNRKTGDMIARLNDTNRIQQTISYIMSEVSVQVFLLICACSIVFSYSWQIGLICVCFFPLVFFVIKTQQSVIVESQKNYMSAHAINESNYIDTIKGIGIIKLFNRQNYFFGTSKIIFESLQQKIFKLGKIRLKFSLILDFLTTSYLISLIASCIVMVIDNKLKVGELIAIMQIGTIIMQTATSVALTNIQLQEARVAFDRMYEFLSIEAETNKNGAIEFEKFSKLNVNGLEFQFPGRKSLLSNISFEVQKGEAIAITGESGSGKSTLFQIIQKFYSYETGEILVNDIQLNEVKTESWRKMIGVVSQEPALFSGNVIDNILLDTISELSKTEVIEFCVKNGFDKYFQKLPQGYDTPIGEGGLMISGGQKQLICLARCLFYRPSILLLDEPTASMDKNTEKFVIELLNRYKANAAIILISHKDKLTNMATRVYSLKNGQLLN
jgi:ABC-type bacteriocin/lantibiotic exporter with double-glycine peptidase domain